MTTQPFQFEKALAELEEITTWFESTEVDLDAGIAKFERGMELAEQLKQHLSKVEVRVEKIKQRFSDSSPAATQPDEDPTDPLELSDDDPQTDLFTD